VGGQGKEGNPISAAIGNHHLFDNQVGIKLLYEAVDKLGTGRPTLFGTVNCVGMGFFIKGNSLITRMGVLFRKALPREGTVRNRKGHSVGSWFCKKTLQTIRHSIF
jgi:hypothetical protein